ncbi:MAG: hypothetical protein HQ510_01010 [Candidatus Marinimicrobia bacterium]|nr:hypothetical protein [Candidatus Neomarinimicrobiota bacterium]
MSSQVLSAKTMNKIKPLHDMKRTGIENFVDFSMSKIADTIIRSGFEQFTINVDGKVSMIPKI